MSDDKIQAFIDVTQASVATAAQFVEAANGNVDAAVAAYYAETSGPRAGHAASAATGPSRPSASAMPAGFGARTSRTRMATFADLQRRQESASPEQDPHDKLFTGGEKSGLAVQNPDQGNGARGGGRGLVSDIISKARQGAPSDADEPATPAAARAPTYVGRGFRLGTEAEQSTSVVGDEPAAPSQERVHRTLTFWRDGFSIDDGDLYRYDDPKNVQYLEAINSGRAPLELLNVEPYQLVDVRIDQRVDEAYNPPRRPPGFRGSGARLGNSTITGPYSEVPAPAAAPAAASQAAPAAKSGPVQSGDGDATVQIRLANGTAHRRRVNLQGPVQQLYDYVESVSDDPRAFVLQTTFPMKPLTDRDQTIAEAGLNGATVVQRWA